MHKRVPVSVLKNFRVVFEDDLYELACFGLKVHLATDTPTQRSRTTVHGLESIYERILSKEIPHLRHQLQKAGIPLGASIEPDDAITTK
jgi:hypothetical protein